MANLVAAYWKVFENYFPLNRVIFEQVRVQAKVFSTAPPVTQFYIGHSWYSLKHRIPENIIDEIRSRADIFEIVSESVLLKKTGKNFVGLCPFHLEKTPSFTVSPDKQIYHCFGCSVGGNVFKFLMETESIPFVEAVKKLASRTGVQIPQSAGGDKGSPSQRERETLLKINSLAADYFISLLKHPRTGKPGMDYLQSRQFDEKFLAECQMGWASPDWRGLLDHLENKLRCSRGDLEKSGLIIRKEDGAKLNFYDRFRGRIMFPLKDLHGKIVGFAGRVISEDHPKYINSPETALYQKSRLLFGLNGAKTAIRREDRVLIVEGYFDQMRVVEQGFRNVVATCGTALTEAQVGLLKNYTRNVVLVFDSDPAGQSASRRGFDLLLEQGMNVQIIVLPDGHDPDSYILKNGPQDFSKQIESARPFIESYICNTIKNGDIETPTGRTAVINQTLPLLAKIKNSIERSEWVRYLSEQMDVNDKVLLAELKKALTEKRTTLVPPEVRVGTRQDPELYLIHLMLADQEIAGLIREQVPAEEFKDATLRQIAEIFYDLIGKGQAVRISQLLDRTEQPEIRALLTRIEVQPIAFENLKKAAADCIGEIKKVSIEKTILELKQQRNEAEKSGQIERSRELHSRLREMKLALTAG